MTARGARNGRVTTKLKCLHHRADNARVFEESTNEHGKMDSFDRRVFRIDKPGPGALGQSALALVYGLRRSESFPVGAHALVPDGEYSAEDRAGQEDRLDRGALAGIAAAIGRRE